jgi:methylglyoxal/glyoxal reductase
LHRKKFLIDFSYTNKNMSLSMETKIKLNSGTEIPIIGLGTWKAEGKQLEKAIKVALNANYRHFDTASFYGNEQEVGNALQNCGIPRKDLFVTTKVWKTDHGYDETIKAIGKSLELLQMDYVDLYLIHWPHPKKRLQTWKGMEKILEDGKVKAIGVSNYTIAHLEELQAESNIMPAVNQIEFHPYQYEKEVLEYCKSKNIVVEAYSPLIRAKKMKDPVLVKYAKKYHKSTAQLLIRWGLQNGVVSLPKSTNRKRIIENTDVFNFEISQEDMSVLNTIDEEFRVVDWNPKTSEWD